MKVELKEMECLRCGYKWKPRKTEIRQCPKCKSAYFDMPKAIKSRRSIANPVITAGKGAEGK